VIDKRDTKIGFIAFGTTTWSLEESRDQLRHERGVETSYFRLRALPFTQELNDFVAAHDRIYIVEQNRDGQMADLIRLAVGEDQRKIRKILHYTGLPCDARTITDAVLKMESTANLPEPLLLVRAEAKISGATGFSPSAVGGLKPTAPQARTED
jgi:2-oxoglutarate ferredoxin oxidoreductase subunit alpha